MPLVYRRLARATAVVLVGATLALFSSRASAGFGTTSQPRFSIAAYERYFEPDEGDVVGFRIDLRGDASLGPDASLRAAESALAAWSGVAGSSIRLRNDGALDDLSRSCPGPNKILFNDPDGILPAPTADPDNPGACRGVLALGIARASTFESKGFAGSSFDRTRCGFVVVADGWGACSNWTECNLAEAITHELGHVLGLDHSSGRDDEPDENLRDAAMYFRAHFDGRCASVRADDENGTRALYPADVPLTITTPSPLPPAQVGVPYEAVLASTPGATIWSLPRSSATGVAITPDGRVVGVPERAGDLFLVARAEGASGEFHEKVLEIRIAPGSLATPTPAPTMSPSATPTASSTATSTPRPSSTSTSTPTAAATPSPVAPCAGDCSGDRTTTVDEILLLVNRALGEAAAPCPAGDGDGNGSITVDEIIAAVDRALRGCFAAFNAPGG